MNRAGEMDRKEIVALMGSSKSEAEWKNNCDTVKNACGGKYPDTWQTDIIDSGLMLRVTNSWDHSAKPFVGTAGVVTA